MDSKELKKYEIILLRDLFESVKGLYLFTFHSKYRLQPDELFHIVKKLKDKDLLTVEEGKLLITDKGKEEILKNNFKKSPEREFNIPQYFLGKKIDINEPYVPELSYFWDKDKFKR